MTSTTRGSLSTMSTEHIIHSEIMAVTSAMRRNSRWASRTARRVTRDDALADTMGLRRTGHAAAHTRRTSNLNESDLLGGFQDLERKLHDVEALEQQPLIEILDPFLALVRSPLSTGPITSVTLNSISSFFTSGVISRFSTGTAVALAELSNAVADCKFEASDVSSDEVVTLRIMMVIRDCMLSEIGSLLGDFEVCEMLEAVLTTCCQMRLSEILRRSASSTMHALVRKVFTVLKTLDPTKEDQLLEMSGGDHSPNICPGELNMQVKATLRLPSDGTITTEDQAEKQLQEEHVPQNGVRNLEDARLDTPPHSPTKAPAGPFGLPAVTELLRVLINLLDPNDKSHTDATRLISLSLLNTIFETSGFQIGLFSTLKSMVVDHGCKYLFLLARSENPSVLYLSLRVISTMFETMRQDLKLQQELFLAFTLDRLTPPPPTRNPNLVGNKHAPSTPIMTSPAIGSPHVPFTGDDAVSEASSMPASRPTALPARGETRELLLQTLTHLCRGPSFMVDLYVNYDCDVNCENLLERLVTFATKGVYPSHYAGGFEQYQQASQALCLDLLLSFVQHVSRRAEGANEPWPDNFPPSEDLLHSKSQKQLILTGALRFNTKPKLGLSFLEENKLIYADGLPRNLSLAKFLRTCPRLDKKLLGDFISKPENQELLNEFMGLLDFKGTPIAEAMREMLEAFRLPGEAQQIARITETFALKYFSTEPDVIKTEDAVYVLAYSIIMLNTDLHNPQIRKRMSLEDYQRNVRGINDKKDFPPEYLKAIYDSIRKREIVMPEEHVGQVGFEYAWKELLNRSQKSGQLMICNTSLFDPHIFRLTWKTVISALSFAFTYYDDDYIVQRAISGFQQCAMLAKQFDIPEVFDHVVSSVSPATSLLDVATPSSFNYPVAEVEGQQVTVSSLSVQFGGNLKGQLASVVLFRIVNGNANALEDGWVQIMEIYLTLFLHSLLPLNLLHREDFLGGSTMIPLQGAAATPQPLPRTDVGLLSALSSYLMTPYGSSADPVIPQATEKEIESTLCTVDCITACRIDEFYEEILNAPGSTLPSVLRALKLVADRRLDENLSDADAHASRSVSYDPGAVFLLETMISVANHGKDFIEELWPIVFEHLNDVLSRAASNSTLLVERAVVGLVHLCSIIVDVKSMRDQLYLAIDLLGSLQSTVLNGVGEQVMTGLVALLKGRRDLIVSSTEWALVFGLVRGTMSHPVAGRISFDLLTELVSDPAEPPVVNSENFISILGVLQQYPMMAGSLAETQKRRKAIPGSPTEPIGERGMLAVDLIFDLRKRLQRLFAGSLTPRQVWTQFSLPLLVALAHQCSNANREVRHTALSHLQRLLLGPATVLMGDHPEPSMEEDIFNRVLFPLVDELLKPEIIQRDISGMSETRLRLSSLLCRTFLQFEIQPGKENNDFRHVWIQVLDLLDRLMNLSQRDPLHEAVPESLKNVILVMYASEFLVKPSVSQDDDDTRTRQQQELWTATSDRLERFLPGFLIDILGAPSPMAPIVQSFPLASNSPIPSAPPTPTPSFKPKTSSIL